VDLSPAAEDALLALFAVKEGFVSEAAVEKALFRRDDEGERLSQALVEAGRLTAEQAAALAARLDPDVIAGYRIEGEAGRGGMGVVYRARQLSMERVVAVKVLSRRHSEDRGYVAKFLDEARSAAKLNHEHVVAAIDAGESNGIYYFVMEFIDGHSVADELEEAPGKIPWERSFEIGAQVARALDHAHGVGIVHRDVKPENVLITRDGTVKLCDLGLAKPAQVAGTGEKSDMTEGTPYYCSPEQALGRTDIDARSDVYSLGLTLYHMIVGEPAFDGESARAILKQQVRAPFPDLARAMPDVPKPLRRLLADMVAKDRDDRLPDMRTFLTRLEAALDPDHGSADAEPGPLAGRGPLVLAGAVFLAFLLLGGALTAALVGGGGDGGERADADPPPDPQATEAPATPSPRPTVTRVDPAVESPAPTRRTPSPAPTRPPDDLAARAALDAAWTYSRDHDEDPLGAAERFAEVARRWPGTPAAAEAAAEVAHLDARAREVGLERFEALTGQVIELTREQRFRAATERVDAFVTRWREHLPSLEEQVPSLIRLIEKRAGARLDALTEEVTAALETREPARLRSLRAELEALADRTPPGVAQRAQGQLLRLEGALDLAIASPAWDAARAERDRALARGDLDGAAAALATAADDPRLEPLADQVRRARERLAALRAAWDACDATLARLARDDRVDVLLADGDTLRGRIAAYDGGAWTLDFVEVGAREPVAVDLRDVAPERLLSLVLPPSEARANALFFLARRAPAAAEAALAAGGVEDAALEAEIAAVRREVVEERAAAWVADVLAADADPAAVVAALDALPDELPATRAYADRFDDLKAAYIAARSAVIAGEPAALFRGQLEVERDGAVSIEYEFEDPGELDDWRPDPDASGGSEATWDEDAGMLVKGKVAHRAHFAGGELEVEVRAATTDDRRPNFNLVLGDTGGWSGCLIGVGFVYGGLTSIDVDEKAEEKAGYEVPLPADVFLPLAGREPRKDSGYLAADNTRALGQAGRRHKLEVDRDDDGDLRVKFRSRTTYSLDAHPGWGDAGAVALAPFRTQLAVSEVRLEGRLDPAWLEAECRTIAEREALALPAPRPARDGG